MRGRKQALKRLMARESNINNELRLERVSEN